MHRSTDVFTCCIGLTARRYIDKSSLYVECLCFVSSAFVQIHLGAVSVAFVCCSYQCCWLIFINTIIRTRLQEKGICSAFTVDNGLWSKAVLRGSSIC